MLVDKEVLVGEGQPTDEPPLAEEVQEKEEAARENATETEVVEEEAGAAAEAEGPTIATSI